MANDKFKITGIDETTGIMTVEFTFKGEKKIDTIANLPLEDDKALEDALNRYAKAYRSGLKQEKETKKTVAPKVKAMVDKSTDINEDANAQQVNS